MKGDFSRRTSENGIAQGYTQVLQQQGRVQLDADWNEQQALHQYRDETEAQHTIGQCGAPKHDPGFAITVVGGAIQIGPGSFYVDGILCHNPAQIDYTAQSDLLDATAVDAVLAEAGVAQGLLYLDVWQRHVTFLDDGYLREKALGGPDTTTRLQTVWQVRVLPLPDGTPLDAEALRFRIRRQLDLNIPAWNDLIAPGQGTLNARTVAPEANEDPCLLPPTSGFRGLENQLYRVEVHRGGALNQATFKWSRDNGAIVAAIVGIDGAELMIANSGRDASLAFAPGDWVEIVNDADDLGQTPQPGQLIQVAAVDPAARKITLDAAPTVSLDGVDADTLAARHYQLRRWDQIDASATADGIAMTGDWQTLENGVQVLFSDAEYRTGDYWLIPARTATGEIEWPPFAIPNTAPLPQPRHGVEHHFCPLAIVRRENETLAVDDLRILFPPLTDLSAADVSYDNQNCANRIGDVTTVQEAIDALCAITGGGTCTYVARPGEDLQALFDRIGDNGDAQVCFQTGLYETARTVTVANKGRLTLTGVGAGTRLVATEAEAVFHFQNCAGVTVRDLSAEARIARATGDANHLNGALTFCGCLNVDIESATVRCAAGTSHSATCITVLDTCDENPAPTRTIPPISVRIRHCDLTPGHFQSGILLVNVHRAQVEDNHIRVAAKPQGLTFDRFMHNLEARAAVRRLMLSSINVTPVERPTEPPIERPTEPPVEPPIERPTGPIERPTEPPVEPPIERPTRPIERPTRPILRPIDRIERLSIAPRLRGAPATITIGSTLGNHTVRFTTDRALAAAWQPLIAANPPTRVTRPRDLTAHLNRLADRLLLGERVAETPPAILDWLNAVRQTNPAAAYQGIVVGGQMAHDIRILNNTIEGVMQGIRVGISRRETQPGEPLRARTVIIEGNSIGVILPPIAVRERYGIFVGNCDSLLVENNYLEIQRFSQTVELVAEGIRIFGHFGKRIIARQNHLVREARLVGFTIGIRVHALNTIGGPQWLVAHNVASVAANTTAVRQVENFA